MHKPSGSVAAMLKHFKSEPVDRSHHFVKPKLDWAGDEERSGATFMCFRLDAESESFDVYEIGQNCGFDWAIYNADGRLITEAGELEDSLVGAQLAAEEALQRKLFNAAETLDDACLRPPPLPAPDPLRGQYHYWSTFEDFSCLYSTSPALVCAHPDHEVPAHPDQARIYRTCAECDEPLCDTNYTSLCLQCEMNEPPPLPVSYPIVLAPFPSYVIPAIDIGNPHYEEKEPSGYDQILAQIKREAEEVKL